MPLRTYAKLGIAGPKLETAGFTPEAAEFELEVAGSTLQA